MGTLITRELCRKVLYYIVALAEFFNFVN